MSGVDLALAIVGTVDVTIKYGKALIETCHAFRHAEKEIFERTLRIESCWNRTSLQLDFLARIWGELDQEHQNVQSEILTVLNEKLRAADHKLNSYLKVQQPATNALLDPTLSSAVKVKRFKYASLKDSLDKTVGDMESWQKLFDPSWFLIMRIASQRVDRELESAPQDSKMITTASSVRDSLRENPQQYSSMFLPEDGLDTAEIIHIPFSSTTLARRAGSHTWLLLDPMSCDSALDFGQRRKAIRDLARKLKATDPSTFALLRCAGVVAKKASHEFQLVFRTPYDTSAAQTLRHSPLSRDTNHSLSERFRLATQLSRAICSIHTFGFVHKSIRPENIILFEDKDSRLGSAFLLGFEKIRPEEGASKLTSDNDWEKNLYRHPQRQGVTLQATYIMQHDIYSLGVCLLEIGLWGSFVQYTDTISNAPHFGEYNFGEKAADNPNRAECVKKDLIALARESLPNYMGSNYAKIVVTCLTCLDEGSEDFGDETELQDEDGVLVAVRYVEKVSYREHTIRYKLIFQDSFPA
ncbi:MAG: hypothetical protein M1822_009112 [Bathelium mastoideum]|nr:MAG: hypothetical protein M1822_009112 [Bathelium mastoideum]